MGGLIKAALCQAVMPRPESGWVWGLQLSTYPQFFFLKDKLTGSKAEQNRKCRADGFAVLCQPLICCVTFGPAS